jgi:hypothetical protein
MGSAASSNANTLSIHQTSEIVRKMKEQYEICQKNNLNLEQQQEKLFQSYNDILVNVVNTPHYMLPKSILTPTKSSGAAKDLTPKKSRRRSFDNNKTSPIKSKLSPQKSSIELHASESLPVLPASDPPPQGHLLSLNFFHFSV